MSCSFRWSTYGSPRVSSVALVLSVSLLGGCSVGMALGELDSDSASLLGGSPTAAPLVYPDARVPPGLSPPELTLAIPEAEPGLGVTASVGDLDGDGLDDMASLVLDYGTGIPHVHVRYGGPRPVDALGTFAFDESGARLALAGANAFTLRAVQAAGDVDGDGFGDLFVVTWICDGPAVGDGGYLLYGGPTRLSGPLDLAVHAAHLSPPPNAGRGSACAGHTVAAPGDLDGDGFDDLALVDVPLNGFPEADAPNHGVYLFFGRAERFAAGTPWSEADVFWPVAFGPFTGLRVSAGGDLDGDQRNELLVEYRAWGQVDGRRLSDPDARLIIIPGSTARSAGALGLLDIPTQLRGGQGLALSRPVGDIDGDGFDELVATAADERTLLFYGGPELLAGPLDEAQAAATLDRGAILVPLGDRDGDGDDELGSMRRVRDYLGDVTGFAVLTLSGSRERLSGDISFGPESSIDDAHIYPGAEARYLQDLIPAGDLDGDGAADAFTRSSLKLDDDEEWDPEPQLHVHYGVPVAPLVPEGPR